MISMSAIPSTISRSRTVFCIDRPSIGLWISLKSNYHSHRVIHTQKTPVKAHAQARVARLVIVFDIRVVHGLYADVRINCTYLFVSMVLHLPPPSPIWRARHFFQRLHSRGFTVLHSIYHNAIFRAQSTKYYIPRVWISSLQDNYSSQTRNHLGSLGGGGDRALTFVYCVSSALYCEHPFN